MSTTEGSPSNEYQPRRYPNRLLNLLKFYPVPNPDEREILRTEIEVGGQNVALLRAIESQAIDRTRKKLYGIGMTLTDYSATLQAFSVADINTLRIISDSADENIAQQRAGIQSTANRYYVGEDEDGKRIYTDERELLHEDIIKYVFEGKQPSENPKLLIIGGPPGGGKSEARRQFIEKNGDAILADPDEIRHYLMDDFDPQNNSHIQATYQESYDIADKIFMRAVSEGYNVIHEGTLRDIEGQGKGIGASRAIRVCKQKGYDVEADFVSARLEECFRRAIVSRERGVALSVLLKAAKGFGNFLDFKDSADVDMWRIIDNTTDGSLFDRNVDQNGIEVLSAYYQQFINES